MEALVAELEEGRFFPMEAVSQSWTGSAGWAAGAEWPHASSSCLPSHAPCIPAELLTGKSKGYFTTDYKYLKPERMSGCFTAKDSTLAQLPLLPSTFLIWQDRRLQPYLMPFLCIPSSRVDIHLLSLHLCCTAHQLHARVSKGNIQEMRSHQQPSTNLCQAVCQ